MNGASLLAAVEVAQQDECLACALDRNVRVVFEGREPLLTDPQHPHVRLLGMGAEQALG